MRKKLLLLATSIAAGVLLTMGMSLAYYTDTETATNVVTMGNVNIQVTEELPKTVGGQEWTVVKATDKDGKETGGLEYANILPGATVSKKPMVKNVGANDAYIRAKVTITVTGENGTELSSDGVSFDTATVDSDGYIYIDGIVTPNQEVTLFNQFKIPATWGNQYANANIEIQVVAEAVQADHITVTGTGAAATKSAFEGVTIEKYES